MQRDELAGWLRLTLTSGLGDAARRKLLAAFGLPDAIFQQAPEALTQVVGPEAAQALRGPPPGLDERVDRTWDWLHAAEPGERRRFIPLGDPHYPGALLQMADPPLALYTLGADTIDPARLPRALSIVGSRNPTPQGALNARQFGHALADAGWCVVSGLALGVDGAAHQGALEAPHAPHVATVAVVGTGLDRVYPARHRELARRIAERGLLVSEFALGTPPLTQNFPRRNRIIAGLGEATLVVEAALQSGSLITARLAVEQGKEVFAIPGSIHSPQARGCHALIRQGAKLVESVRDIAEELPAPSGPFASPRQRDTGPDTGPGLDADADADADGIRDPAANEPREAALLLRAIGHDPVSLDALSARTGQSASVLQAELLMLELQGRVARLPGGLYQRCEVA